MPNQYALELFKGFLYWLVFPSLITIAGLLFPQQYVSHSTMLMLYLINVLLCSMRAGHPAVLASSISSFLLFNYFFTTPRYSLWMQEPSEIIAAVFFINFSMLAGGVSWKLRKQLRSLQTQSEFLRQQISLGQKLQAVENETQTAPLLAAIASDIFDDCLRFQLLPPNSMENPEPNWRVTWAMRDGKPLDADKQAMLISIREQVQAVLDRLSVSRALKSAERKSDEDRLRTALLSSVSHDLKTPLVTMIGAATAVRDLGTDLNGEQARALLDSIISESRRLEGYIQNLLDMTRLGYGTLSLSRQWVTMQEVFHEVMKRMDLHRPGHNVTLEASDNLPALYVHAALIEQAFFNALDNAIKAGGASSPVVVQIQKTPNKELQINICDHGPGLPESEWEHVFDQFYTYKQKHEEYEKGAGLGLSICRSIMRVHGGDAMIVPSSKDFSFCLRLSLPLENETDVHAPG